MKRLTDRTRVVHWIDPHRTLLLGILFALLLPTVQAHADVGPKPEMNFRFTFDDAPLAIVSGQLIECDDESCATGEPLEELGPQDFSCSESECSSMAYTYASYHKLVIEFEDRTRESNVFAKKAFRARYEVTVSETDLQVVETKRLFGSRLCLPGLILTLVVETLIAGSYLRAFGLSQAVLPWAPVASLLSLPILWFAFPLLGVPSGWIVGLGEAFVLALETTLLYAVSRRVLAFKHVVVLTVLMNAMSFVLGLLP